VVVFTVGDVVGILVTWVVGGEVTACVGEDVERVSQQFSFSN